MTTDVEREAFELEMGFVDKPRREDGEYKSDAVQHRWDGWQAGAAWQRAKSAPVVPEGYVLVPVAATAENGAKAALLGEFTIQHQATCSGCYYDEADEDCEVCGGEVHYTEHVTVPWDTIKEIYAEAVRVLAAPAQPAAQGEFGDAYQGTREDLAIWKRRALEAEAKVRHQDQIIDHLTLEAQGETRMGEPVIPAARQEQGDGMCNADEPSNRCICREEFGYKVCGPRGTEVHQLRRALEHARLFIRNGIDLGYIRMPDADTPDPAHETLPMIDAAMSASAEGK